MNRYVCIDSCVFIKLFFEEEDSSKARKLFLNITNQNLLIVLPTFAWAEVGSIFIKKVRNGSVSFQAAESMWNSFIEFPGVMYVEDSSIMNKAWSISTSFDLPTLYDAAFLAVAELIQESSSETCDFWTADTKLVNSLGGKKTFVKNITDL